MGTNPPPPLQQVNQGGKTWRSLGGIFQDILVSLRKKKTNYRTMQSVQFHLCSKYPHAKLSDVFINAHVCLVAHGELERSMPY